MNTKPFEFEELPLNYTKLDGLLKTAVEEKIEGAWVSSGPGDRYGYMDGPVCIFVRDRRQSTAMRGENPFVIAISKDPKSNWFIGGGYSDTMYPPRLPDEVESFHVGDNSGLLVQGPWDQRVTQALMKLVADVDAAIEKKFTLAMKVEEEVRNRAKQEYLEVVESWGKSGT